MKQIVNNWHNISVYLAGALFLVVVFFVTDPVQQVLLSSAAVLFLHFFEEFGWPGGFPYMGMKVMMGSAETDSTKWNCNNLNSMFGNWLSVVLLYILPALLLDVKFLTIGAMTLSVLELMVHGVLFPLRGKTCYNPGAITAIFGLVPIAIYYFVVLFDPDIFAWYDYVLGVVWFAVIFYVSFRSPFYWRIGGKEGYPLTEQAAFGYHKPQEINE